MRRRRRHELAAARVEEVAVAVDFWVFLNELQDLSLEGRVDTWRRALIACPDLFTACPRDDVAAARTAIAAVTLRTWPSSRWIPHEVHRSLEALGVVVKW